MLDYFNPAVTFDDVLLAPRYNSIPSRKDVDVSTKMGRCTFDIPIMSSNMDTITGEDMALEMDKLGGVGVLHRFMSAKESADTYKSIQKLCDISDQLYDFYRKKLVIISLGVNEDLERLKLCHKAGARLFCLDIAHGHQWKVKERIREIKNYNSEFEGKTDDIYLIAGNVATPEGAQFLLDSGADAVKIGIGPGSACSTRLNTGCGIPQLTAIMSIADACPDACLIADGGIRSPGDVVKALAAGANMVMLGGMLAGTDETPGDGSTFRGMASKEAMREHTEQAADYKTAEGESFEVPGKGPVKDVIQHILGGLRSGMTYCGASNISELQARADFVRITPSGMVESSPHLQV